MTFNVTTYLADQKIKSEDIKIQNKLIYGVLNKYIRAKQNLINKEQNINKNVVSF